MNQKMEIQKNDEGKRLDIYLTEKFPQYSRNYLQGLIKNKAVFVNEKTGKAGYTLKTGDRVEIEIKEEPSKGELIGEKIDLDIIYEDDNVIVINKQAGLVVHPGSGNLKGTLINALVEYFPPIKEAVYDKNNPISLDRPGLVHRLDKDTSGVMIIAKNVDTMQQLVKQIQNRTVKKSYLALCFGWPKQESGRLANYIGRHSIDRQKMADIGREKGKEAITDYKVLRYFTDSAENKISLVHFDLLTGRTHQIRLQMSLIHHPILGDKVYGSKESRQLSNKLQLKRQILHAKSLGIYLPDNENPSQFEAPLPADFRQALKLLHEK